MRRTTCTATYRYFDVRLHYRINLLRLQAESPIWYDLCYGDWLKKEFSWRVSHINAAGREVLRPFAKALKNGDMLCFAKGAFLIALNGMEDVLVPWMREFQKIPAVKFKDEKASSRWRSTSATSANSASTPTGSVTWVTSPARRGHP